MDLVTATKISLWACKACVVGLLGGTGWCAVFIMLVYGGVLDYQTAVWAAVPAGVVVAAVSWVVLARAGEP